MQLNTYDPHLMIYTPCSKRKYTLCFPVSTQNVAGAGRPAVLSDSQSEFPNNQAWVCEEIPNSFKVLRKSLLGCCVTKFTKISFCHWLLCYWLIKCIRSNFDSELWNHLEFVHKFSFVCCGISTSYPPYPLMGPICCRFWILTHQNSKCILSFGVECKSWLTYSCQLPKTWRMPLITDYTLYTGKTIGKYPLHSYTNEWWLVKGWTICQNIIFFYEAALQ